MSRQLLWIATTGVAYYLGAQAAFLIGTFSDGVFAPFWPPNTILFWALLLAPLRTWWMYVAAVFPAHVIAELGVGMPIPQLMVAFATNCALALVTAYGVRRFVGGPPWFSTLRHALTYICIAAVAGPAICAFGGALVQIFGGGAERDYWSFWLHWFGANALGGATVAPFLLAWTSQRARQAFARSSKVEAALLLIGLVLASLLAFDDRAAVLMPTLLYLPAPFIIWALLRFGTAGAMTVVLLVEAFAVHSILQGSTVFNTGTAEHNVLALQAFFIAIGVHILLLGATVEELRHTQGELQTLVHSLLRIQEHERRDLSKELHERIAQDLAAARLAISRLGAPRAEEGALTADELKALLGNTIDDIKSMSQLLYPPLLDEFGLTSALKEHVCRLSRQSGVEVKFTAAPSMVDTLPPRTQSILFRVVQGAFAYIHRYSGAGAIQLALQGEARANGCLITITLRDAARAHASDQEETWSAVAAPPSAAEIGLIEIRERLKHIGATMEKKTADGDTRIQVFMPKIYEEQA